MTKRLILLLIVVSLPACHNEYRANENIENLSGSKAKFGGIVGTAYDCSNKPLPYASLYLNKIPNTLKMKLNDSIFFVRDMVFFHDEYMNIQVIADSLGRYVFDSVPKGNYQVVLLPFPLDTTGLSSRISRIETLEVKPDSFVEVHVVPIPHSHNTHRRMSFPYQNNCDFSAVDFVQVKSDSCAFVKIRLIDSITEEMKPQIIWNPKYRPCDWNLD